MDSEGLEVECPVCDHKIAVDAARCPNCKAVFSLSGVDELETVARELKAPVAVAKPSEGSDDPSKTGRNSTPGPKGPASADPKEKNGLLSKLFKKKK